MDHQTQIYRRLENILLGVNLTTTMAIYVCLRGFVSCTRNDHPNGQKPATT